MTNRAEHHLPDEPPGRANDGGPAFPQIDWRRAGDREFGTTVGGATLLDYFAAHAPPAPPDQNPDVVSVEEIARRIAHWNFTYARAMLEVRKYA